MKIQYEERTYGTDTHGHASYRAGKTYHYFEKLAECCDKASKAWREGDVFDFDDTKLQVQIAQYDDDPEGAGSWYWEPIVFCPWCGTKITYECVKKTKVEYDCKEIEEKRTVCEERIVEVKA